MRTRRAICPPLLALCLSCPAFAQTSVETGPALEVALVTGYAGFIDEEMLDHGVVGASLRWDGPGRLGALVEALYMVGPGEDRDWVVAPNLVFDFRRSGVVVPYVVVGGGMLRHTDRCGTGLWTSYGWTVGGGLGMRASISNRVSLAVEGRLGTEPLARLTASVGYRLR